MVDIEILRMFLANRDVIYQPQPRSRAVNLQTKLGEFIYSKMTHFIVPLHIWILNIYHSAGNSR